VAFFLFGALWMMGIVEIFLLGRISFGATVVSEVVKGAAFHWKVGAEKFAIAGLCAGLPKDFLGRTTLRVMPESGTIIRVVLLSVN
jgi:hypothetical protein